MVVRDHFAMSGINNLRGNHPDQFPICVAYDFPTPAETVQPSPAFLKGVDDQIAADQFSRGRVIKGNGILRMSRRLDNLPCTKTGRARLEESFILLSGIRRSRGIEFEIPDPAFRKGQVNAVSQPWKGNTRQTVKTQMVKSPHIAGAPERGGKKTGKPVPDKRKFSSALDILPNEWRIENSG